MYPNGAFRMDRGPATAPLLSDWKEGMPDPEWCPVAGGKGFGIPTGKDCSSGKPQTPSQTTPTNSTGPATYGNTTQSDSQDPSQDNTQDTNQGSSPSPGKPSKSKPTVDDKPAAVPSSPEPIPSGDVASQDGPSPGSSSSSGNPGPTTAGKDNKNKHEDGDDGTCAAADDDDGTCAADEVEVDDKPEAKAKAPKASEPKTSKPKTSEPKPETSNEGAADDDDTCAADEVWVDEL